MTLLKESMKFVVVRWVVLLTFLATFVLIVVRLLLWIYNVRVGGHINV